MPQRHDKTLEVEVKATATQVINVSNLDMWVVMVTYRCTDMGPVVGLVFQHPDQQVQGQQLASMHVVLNMPDACLPRCHLQPTDTDRG